MGQKKRLIIGVMILVVVGAVVLGSEYLRGRSQASQLSSMEAAPSTTSKPADNPAVVMAPGSVPIYLDGELAAGITPADLEPLEKASFIDADEGKPQDGWLLRDVLLIYLAEDQLSPDTRITITSSSRNKSAELTWAEVDDAANMVMFDLSNRGTLKLVSLLEKLDMRDEWVQDADRIDVISP